MKKSELREIIREEIQCYEKNSIIVENINFNSNTDLQPIVEGKCVRS